MKQLIFVKFGGSAITDKTKPLSINTSALEQIAEEMSVVWKEKPQDTMYVLGNGAGSFGHYHAHKLGTDSPQARAVIHKSVVELNHLLVSKLVDVGLPVFSFHPSSLFSVADNKVESANIHAVRTVLESGGIPMVYGDILNDSNGSGTIFSTERVFRELMEELHNQYSIRRVVHIGTVAGVFDAEKKVIPHITKASWESVKNTIFGTEGFDVTGGMRLKVEESLSLTEWGVESIICNMEEHNTLIRAVAGSPTFLQGTRITS